MIEYPKSEFEEKLDRELLEKTAGKVRTAVEFLLADKPLEQLMGFCNVVSVERLAYNDHGRVHAKIATLNALKIIKLLEEAGVCKNISGYGNGSFYSPNPVDEIQAKKVVRGYV